MVKARGLKRPSVDPVTYAHCMKGVIRLIVVVGKDTPKT